MTATTAWPGIGEVIGVDRRRSSSIGRALARGVANLSFEQADGRDLPFPSSAFDVVVFHTKLCHIPGLDEALREAFRVLRPTG